MRKMIRKVRFGANPQATDVPVKFLGVGEAAEDLAPFDPAEFARELLSDE